MRWLSNRISEYACEVIYEQYVFATTRGNNKFHDAIPGVYLIQYDSDDEDALDDPRSEYSVMKRDWSWYARVQDGNGSPSWCGLPAQAWREEVKRLGRLEAGVAGKVEAVKTRAQGLRRSGQEVFVESDVYIFKETRAARLCSSGFDDFWDQAAAGVADPRLDPQRSSRQEPPKGLQAREHTRPPDAFQASSDSRIALAGSGIPGFLTWDSGIRVCDFWKERHHIGTRAG
ncbi:hypothetical protein ON010_g22 [Phytophthora cinnamomi]|nr:hypothetical protein ON010_g22 [Phytophthora cinnamomi]